MKKNVYVSSDRIKGVRFNDLIGMDVSRAFIFLKKRYLLSNINQILINKENKGKEYIIKDGDRIYISKREVCAK